MRVATEWGQRKLYCECNSVYDPDRNLDFPDIDVLCPDCDYYSWFYIDSKKGRYYQDKLKRKGLI